jgi:hypothetical protein
MKRTRRAVLGVLAASAMLGAAQPASGQVIESDCLVAGGGRIVAANGDQATFGGSAATQRARVGQEVYIDHGPVTQLRFRSLVTTAVVCDLDARRAEIIGTGEVVTDLGVPQIVQYRIAVFAPNNRGGSPDFYRITLSNGYDSGEQPVLQGNINLIAR